MIYNKPQRKKGETWIFNESMVGHDRFDFSIRFFAFDATRNMTITYSTLHVFLSGLARRTKIEFRDAEDRSPDWTAFVGGQWIGDYDRIITFLDPPTGDLLAWLQKNAVKQ